LNVAVALPAGTVTEDGALRRLALRLMLTVVAAETVWFKVIVQLAVGANG